MTKIHIVDTLEGTLDSYDVEDFCRRWNKGEIVDTHRNHYQYKIYSDINKARSLLKHYTDSLHHVLVDACLKIDDMTIAQQKQKANVPTIIEAIEGTSASRKEKDKAIKSIKEMYDD